MYTVTDRRLIVNFTKEDVDIITKAKQLLDAMNDAIEEDLLIGGVDYNELFDLVLARNFYANEGLTIKII